MFHFRQVLVRLRAGDTVREVARAGLMSRGKQAELVAVAKERGWLEPGNDLPDDEAIAAAMAPRKRAASTVSAAEPMREVVQRWFDAGVQGRAIHAALQREHGFTGSYSAVVRMLRGMKAAQPPETTVRCPSHRARPRRWTSAWGRSAHPPRRQAAAHLGLRDDAGAQPPPVRRIGVRKGPRSEVELERDPSAKRAWPSGRIRCRRCLGW
jgi:hypothetical protein